jgi:hypothetical protein
LPNTTLLARADALHVELTGEARAHLAGLLVRFRAALEAQDPATIEEARQALAGLIEHYRRV